MGVKTDKVAEFMKSVLLIMAKSRDVFKAQKCVLHIVASPGCLSVTVQSLTLKGCFHIHLPEGESFFVLT